MVTTNEKKIFKKQIAIKLRERGFKILRTEVNKTKPQFDVYIFEDTHDLEESFWDIVHGN